MQVFKFGGASVNSVERIKQLVSIIKNYPDEQILVVVSAMGKTTNALEKVAEAFYHQESEKSLELFQAIKNQHLTTAKYLLVENYLPCEARLRDIFTEVEWLLHDRPVRDFDYYYDQIVCCGELVSTAIISAFLEESGVHNLWLDVRDIFRTDNNFRDAGILWDITSHKVTEFVKPLFSQTRLVVTQGFIGATDENESTTLGREGSDYSAAVFANLLGASKQTIWKDVEGVMNADPKKFPEARLLPEPYYGAQVIHPKTIKPLQNKNIPLQVKCFLDPSLPGTVIHHRSIPHLPPIIVVKENQLLLHLHTQDFSFIGEKPISRLYEMLAELKIKPNLIQSGAVSLAVCLDDRTDKMEKLATEAAGSFEVQLERSLTLLTIRHYNEEILKRMTDGKNVLLRQQSPETVQVLYR
jgi:aspartate kinase